jgi:hypothetical protein
MCPRANYKKQGAKMNTETIIQPGENSPTKQKTDRLELEVQQALKASVEPPKTELAGVAVVGEKLEDNDLVTIEDSVASAVDAMQQRLRKLAKDPTRTGASRVLERGKEARRKAEDLAKQLQAAAQKQRKKIEVEAVDLESVKLRSVIVDDGILNSYASRISEGSLRLSELATSSSQRERSAALRLAQDYPALIPESERIPADELADLIDSRFSGDVLQKINQRQRAVESLEEAGRKILRQAHQVSPADLVEKIEGMMA